MRIKKAVWLLAMAASPAQALSTNNTPAIGPAPVWIASGEAVTTAKLETPPAQAGAPIAMLRNDHQVRFNKDGDEDYFHSVVRILSPQGLTALGTISISWSPDTSALTVHRLHILRGSETIDVIGKGQQFTVLRRENNLEQQTLNGFLTAAIQPEGLQVGDIVDLAFTIRTKDPVLAGHSEGIVGGFDGSPGTPVRLRAIWPNDMPVRWRATPGLPSPKMSQKSGFVELDLTTVGGETIAPPGDAPARFNPTRILTFTDFPSWSAISSLMQPLYAKAASIAEGSPLRTEVDKIKTSSSDPKVLAGLALKLVQDRVRYVYQGMAMGNLVPSAAETTWGRRFGDCKGKTALLIAVLDRLGIKAEPALVSTTLGDGLDGRLPMISLFDHVIVRAEIDGKVYWLDGTRVGDHSVDSLAVPAFHWALPLRSSGVELVPLVVMPPQKPLQDTTIEIDASKGIHALASSEVKTVFRGDKALGTKLSLAALSPTDRDKTLKAYWKNVYNFIEPVAVDAKYDENSGEETLSLSGKAKLDWSDEGYELDGATIGWDTKTERKPGPGADAPVTVAFPFWTTTRETLFLPRQGEGFSLSGGDVDKTLGGYVFGRHTTIQGDVVKMESTVRSTVSEISFAVTLAAQPQIASISRVTARVKAPSGYKRTSTEVEELRASKPETARQFVDRGNYFLESEEYALAHSDLDAAIRLDPQDATALADRALVRVATDDATGAAQDIEAALKIDPKNAVAHNAAARLAENRGDFAEAVRMLSLSIAEWPQNNWALRERANLNGATGKFDDALADAERLKTSDTEYAGQIRRMLLFVAGRYAEALAEVTAQEKLTPKDQSLVWSKAAIYVKIGNVVGARNLYSDLRSNSRSDATQRNGLCWEQAKLNFDLETALIDCEAAIRAKPGESAYLDSMGFVLFRLGRFRESIARYDMATAKVPRQVMSIYGRGLAKLAAGDATGIKDLAAARGIDGKTELAFRLMGLKAPPSGPQASPNASTIVPPAAATSDAGNSTSQR